MTTVQDKLLEFAELSEKIAVTCRELAQALETRAPAEAPPTRPEPAAAQPAMATIEQVHALHRLIKGHTKNKTWDSALRGCGVWAPDGWQEPSNADELALAVVWLKADDAEKMIAKITSLIK